MKISFVFWSALGETRFFSVNFDSNSCNGLRDSVSIVKNFVDSCV